MKQYVVIYRNHVIGPYKTQGGATKVANMLKDGAYTMPMARIDRGQVRWD